MRLIDWINIGAIAVAIIGAAVYIGQLEGRLGALETQVGKLNTDAIARAEKEAAERLRKLAKGPTLIARNFHWKQGSGEVEMIRTNEGFCYLTLVTGKFEGGGEAVRIYVRGGSWFLGGGSHREGVAASARCWKWPVALQ